METSIHIVHAGTSSLQPRSSVIWTTTLTSNKNVMQILIDKCDYVMEGLLKCECAAFIQHGGKIHRGSWSNFTLQQWILLEQQWLSANRGQLTSLHSGAIYASSAFTGLVFAQRTHRNIRSICHLITSSNCTTIVVNHLRNFCIRGYVINKSYSILFVRC